METDRRGSEDSSCSTSTSTISNFSRLQASYNREDWIRLRDTWSAIRAARLSLLEQSNSLEHAIAEQSNYRDYAAEIQNKEIHLKLHKNKLQLAKQRIRAAQSRLGTALKKELKKEKEREELKTSVETMEKDILQVSQQVQTMSLTFVPLYNELIFRRRYMTYELWWIFFPCIANNKCLPETARKNKCGCEMYDSIKGHHLTISSFRTEHSDTELSASAGHLVNLLDCFFKIINLPAKHMLKLNGSRSCLILRDTLDVYNLFPGTKQKRKKSRGHLSSPAVYYFDESLHKLAEVVMHLRTECGLATTERDRPMKNFTEVILLCLGRKLSLGPTNGEEVFINELNPFSPASSAIFRCPSTQSLGADSKVESCSKNRSMNYMQKKFAKGLTVDCDESNSLLSILEVVSPTWSPKKLVSEGTTIRKTSTSKSDASYSLSIHQSPSSAHSKYIPSV